MGFLGQFAPVDRVNKPMYSDKQFGLGAFGIHALRNGNQANAGKRKFLVKIQCIGELSR